ncbi:MAG: hypothetical protein IIA27_14805, partial [Gemmatimonadetes bacterium]|nr:hypothetical protein [Gemmatimonadota bacterium]
MTNEITRRIVTELDVKLISGEDTRAWRNPTDNSRAFNLFLKGLEPFSKITKADNARAQKLFAESLELDPEF